MIHDSKILVVDDEQPVRKLLQRYLKDAGYQCKTSDNAAQAKEMLALEQFDLILSDLKMPGESGLELIKYAKKNFPGMGRVMITAVSSEDIASEILEVGVYGYIVKPLSKNVVLITVENALRHLALDQHTQSYIDEMAGEITRRTAKLDAIMSNINLGVMLVDTEMQILEINERMKEWFSISESVNRKHCFSLIPNEKKLSICDDCPLPDSFQSRKTQDINRQIEINKKTRDFRVVTIPILNKDQKVYAGIVLYEDMTERLQVERDLHQAQKLESVGQLAAGIAHEINTPVQYIGDNLSFLKDSFEDICTVLNNYEKAWPEIKKGQSIAESVIQSIEEDKEDADLSYLMEEIPVTINQSLDGVRRVDKIVKAMKDFSHPGEEEKVPTNINTLIETTLTVCRNEWKYVAEVDKELSSDLKLVPCFPGDLSQVFLNIIVNASHAIVDATNGGKSGLGTITIKTEQKKDSVEITISDTGGGIPEGVQDRVFDPFFTTKDRGKGTGQGLAIAYRVVVKKHGGSINFDTENGVGTTFIIELPVSEKSIALEGAN